MYEIVVGRSDSDKEKYGLRGTIFVGKHYVKMGRTTSLSGDLYLDVATSHVVFVCGKRGGGKSYTLGVITEGMADLPKEIRQNLSFILLDTMGIYWTMKYPNKQDENLLNEWGLKAKSLDIKIYTPELYYPLYKKKGIPTDAPFAIRPADMDSADWQLTFEISPNEPLGVLIERIVYGLKKAGKNYSIQDMVEAVRNDKKADQLSRDALENRLLGTEAWGVFNTEGTPIKEIAKGGQVSVIDLSCYATMPGGWKIKSLITGLISERLFIERMIARKDEEFASVKSAVHYFSEEEAPEKMELPLVWLVLDEAHEFLPREGKTAASDALITIMREGRQPGISLMLATQQPGKIHTDVMTQTDTFISHRITAKMDVDALSMLMQSYMREGLNVQIDNLPRTKGAALIFDDNNERLYAVKIRPRFTWHGGSAPFAIPPTKKTL
ncbi:MAG TPA: ATP-binding protein [Candidatus Nanoarchaeia archaeon]|nr:ATP-binding protein [Candidatus Nanoarchaeia archaeon]